MNDTQPPRLVTATDFTQLVSIPLSVTALVAIYVGLTLLSGEIGHLHHVAGPSTTPTGPLW